MKMCEICGQEKAAVPDRNRMGRPIKRICQSCHALRLTGDLRRVMELREANRERRAAPPEESSE